MVKHTLNENNEFAFEGAEDQAMQDQFTKYFPLNTSMVNPLVLLERGDERVMAQVEALGGRAAWLKRAEAVSKDVWSMATTALAIEIIQRLNGKGEDGRALFQEILDLTDPVSVAESAPTPLTDDELVGAPTEYAEESLF